MLVALEDEKRGLVPGDPRVSELAIRIEEIAQRVLGGASRQRHLGETAEREEGGRPSPDAEAIEELDRPLWQILGEWRDAERRLAVAPPGSVDESEAKALVDHLRQEYRSAQAKVAPPSSSA